MATKSPKVSSRQSADEKILLQFKVSPKTKKKLEALARATTRSMANYLNALVEAHIKAIDPKIVAELHRSWAAIEKRK